MTNHKRASEGFEFFKTTTTEATEEEAARLDGVSHLGQEIAGIAEGWTKNALEMLSRHSELMPSVDFTAPGWLDLSEPDHAIYEWHRIAMQLPKYLPPDNVIESFTPDERLAVEVLYRIRVLSDTVKRSAVPASSAIAIISSSLELGIAASRAHVNPWESFAGIQYKSQNSLINASRGTPEGSPNALRAEESNQQRQKRWQPPESFGSGTRGKVPAQ